MTRPMHRQILAPALLATALVAAGCGRQGNRSSDLSSCELAPASAEGSVQLSAEDVRQIIAQAVTEARVAGLAVTVSVVGHEGDVLGVFRMSGAADTTRIVAQGRGGLTGAVVPAPLAAISKAGTAAYLSTQGHAFNTRTASFIIQEHFPPGVTFSASGPLFGVQFSQLPCSDISRRLTGTAFEQTRGTMMRLPLGLAADPGSVPLYKNGVCVGGLGVEGDGAYTLDEDPTDREEPAEERIAVAGAQGFMAPRCIWGDQILVNGIRFTFLNVEQAGGTAQSFGNLSGSVIPVGGFFAGTIIGGPASRFRASELGGIPGTVSPSFPIRGGSVLDAADVTRILTQATQQADRARAAIRLPLGDAARVNITVVDVDGSVLGIFRTEDAPPFGFEVSVQKARTAAFMSGVNAGSDITAAIGRHYSDAARADGLDLDGSVAFSDRAGGFLARPFYPDGIDGSANGPFSRPFSEWNVFNVGLQLDLVQGALVEVLSGGNPATCTAVSRLKNGLQIFPGSVPLYKDGRLAGGVGVSGDGVDQDDYIAAGGAVGYDTLPGGITRSDDHFVRGVRLPYVKFPAQPNR